MATSVLPANFVRAYLDIDGKNGKPDPTKHLDCYFNPTEYSVAKSNTWQSQDVNGKTSPEQKFTSGEPRKLDLTLLFDQTVPPVKKTVHEATALLLDAMEVPKTEKPGAPTAAPPLFTFGWGTLKFKGACTSLSCTYKLFTPAGEPLRADVKLSLVHVGTPEVGQNPTTRAIAGFGVHRVKDGDTLPSISYRAYGDATKWRLIAEANGVDNPLHLRRGTSLSLPTLEI
jgi:nucleoid-associated protein YgaU